MNQLAHALREAGFRSSDDMRRDQNRLRYQRDTAIGALVKARRGHRKSSHLKAEVACIVRALRLNTSHGGR